MKQFITVEEARDLILAHVRPLGVERVPLNAARGRVLARPVIADQDSPPFDNSAMDGYAVRWADIAALPATLEVVGTIAAGAVATQALGPGEAMRIMTGAPVPEGADTVVQQELCRQDSRQVVVEQAPGPPGQDNTGANVRRAGSYLEAGAPVLEAGDRISAAEISIMASLRRGVVEVYRRPVVAIISTGDELVEIDQTPGPGQIVNSNAYMLQALVEGAGATALVLPIARDDEAEIRAAFAQALVAADFVVSSGGVSVGQFDFVHTVMDELTGGMNFWKVSVKPGKPLAFGIAGSKPLIGLPGNPAAGFVGFHLFVKPALAVASGRPLAATAPLRLTARCSAPVKAARGRRSYIAGRLEQRGLELTFVPRLDQSSGNPALFTHSNAMGVVEGGESVVKGEMIAVELLSLLP